MIYSISAWVALPKVTFDFLDGLTLNLGGDMLFLVLISVALKYDVNKQVT